MTPRHTHPLMGPFPPGALNGQQERAERIAEAIVRLQAPPHRVGTRARGILEAVRLLLERKR